MTSWYYCSTCGNERAFEQPPCLDGHETGCPEWFCVDCGYAIIVDFVIEPAPVSVVDRAA